MIQSNEIQQKVRRIGTHTNIDLDATASCWLWVRYKEKDATIIFKPADWKSDTDDDIILLDMPGGIKNNIDRGYHSCFGALVHQFIEEEILNQDEVGNLKNLLQLIETIERGKEPTNELSNNIDRNLTNLNVIRENLLPNILRCLQSFHNDDNIVMMRMFEIFDGGMKIKRTRSLIKKQFRDPNSKMNSMIHEFGPVVLYRGAARINGRLFAKGAKIIVYSNGNNLGAIREAEYSTIKLDDPKLIEWVKSKEFPDNFLKWRFDPRMATHGTHKSRVESKSLIDPFEFAQFIESLLIKT